MTRTEYYRAEARYRAINGILALITSIACLVIVWHHIKDDLFLTLIFAAAFVVAANITRTQLRMALAYKLKAGRAELRQSLNEAKLRWEKRNK